MSSGYKLRDLHARRVVVELEVGDRRLTMEGIAQHAQGELHIPIKDPGGDFKLILHDATWNGTITDAPNGNGFLIRLHPPIQS